MPKRNKVTAALTREQMRMVGEALSCEKHGVRLPNDKSQYLCDARIANMNKDRCIVMLCYQDIYYEHFRRNRRQAVAVGRRVRAQKQGG
jgi:hypothetical protein